MDQKDTLGPLREFLTGPVEGEKGPDGDAAGGAAAAAAPAGGAGAGWKYVPPSKRGGDNSSAQSRISGASMPNNRREDTATIRVSNLSENAQETDLQVWFHVTKFFLQILYFPGIIARIFYLEEAWNNAHEEDNDATRAVIDDDEVLVATAVKEEDSNIRVSSDERSVEVDALVYYQLNMLYLLINFILFIL